MLKKKKKGGQGPREGRSPSKVWSSCGQYEGLCQWGGVHLSRQPISFTKISSYKEISRKQNNKQKVVFICLFSEHCNLYSV